jgi:hypothetical protein
MPNFNICAVLILLANLIPYCYSACSANADQNKYEGCYYDSSNITNFSGFVANNNANISRCSFVNLPSKPVLESSVEVYVEYTV